MSARGATLRRSVIGCDPLRDVRHKSARSGGSPNREADARLVALAPDLARLLVDAMALIGWTGPRVWWAEDADSLLARFAVLEQRAGEGQG